MVVSCRNRKNKNETKKKKGQRSHVTKRREAHVTRKINVNKFLEWFYLNKKKKRTKKSKEKSKKSVGRHSQRRVKKKLSKSSKNGLLCFASKCWLLSHKNERGGRNFLKIFFAVLFVPFFFFLFVCCLFVCLFVYLIHLRKS